jgi:hypothetical protein
MKLGVIGSSQYQIADDGRQWDLYSFIISQHRLSFFEMLDSAFATPARYIEEIFVRLCRLDRDTPLRSRKFVFNPLFDANELVIMQVVSALRDMAPFDGVTILIDVDGLPAGYLLPGEIDAEDALFLSLLSAVNGEIDAALCRLLFQVDVQCVPVPRLALIAPGQAYSNGFAYKPNRDIYKWTAERAIELLRSTPAKTRETLPITAIMPHHAGDVLFFALACNGTEPRFSRVAVNRAYRDIVADNAPQLAIVSIDETIINRSGEFQQDKATPENVYFHSFKDGLPKDSLYYYCRPSRDYNATSFNLIDHYAFAVGGRFYTEDRLLTGRTRAVPKCIPRTNATEPVRVLLHFDAGWPLKIYPRPHQDRLIDLLQNRGYSVTVLASDPGAYVKCDATTFKGYWAFKELLEKHQFLIGMDSFPAHYAAHVQGVPTICLFSSTRPDNSNAPSALNYASMEAGLRCRPCYGVAKCPLYGAPTCRNFVEPERVFAEMERILAEASNALLHKGNVPLISKTEQDCSVLTIELQPSKIRRISLNHIYMKIFLHRVILRRVRHLSLLVREFSSVAERDGLLHASLRTLHFLTKITRRWKNNLSAGLKGY